MKFTLDEELVEKSQLTMAELLVILLVKTGANITDTIQDMEKKKMITQDMFNHFAVFKKWDIIATDVLLSGDSTRSDESLIELAGKLRDIFPRGKKQGTTKQFRSNTTNVVNKLKKFFKEYGSKYSDDEIVEATQRYVSSFNGNYAYMRVLEYFIWKDVRKLDSNGMNYTERVSDLADYLENEECSSIDNNWTSELV